MANEYFSVAKGLQANLPTDKISGRAWFTTDTKNMYVDVDSTNRIKINDTISITSGTVNFDNYLDTGTYYISSTVTLENGPDGVVNGWLIVLGPEGGGRAKQIFLRQGTANVNDKWVLVRTYSLSAWSAWEKVDNAVGGVASTTTSIDLNNYTNTGNYYVTPVTTRANYPGDASNGWVVVLSSPDGYIKQIFYRLGKINSTDIEVYTRTYFTNVATWSDWSLVNPYTQSQLDTKFDAKADKATTYTKDEIDTDLVKKVDKTDVLSDEVNLLNITGIINNTVDYFTKTLVDNTLTIKAAVNYPDAALNVSLTLDNGKIICNGTTGSRDITIQLSCETSCIGDYLFAIQNQQYAELDYPRIYLGNLGDSNYLIYGTGSASYKTVNISTDITKIYVVLLKNSSFDISFNLSLTKSEHIIPYLPFGDIPKLFVEKTDYYNDTVYPHMFGAVGDGVTDDTVALQLAIDYAVANKKLLKLSGGCTYLISKILSWSGAYIRFDGNNATIKVSDIITPFTSKSLSSVFKINNLADLEDTTHSRYILRRFGNVNIDCNCGRAVYGIYAERGGKTVYQNIMVNNPEFCALRLMNSNEAIISNVHACQTDVNYDDIRNDYKNSVGIYLSASDSYVENCVCVDFIRGFATGGTDNHFSKCHAWNAIDMNKMKNSISFDVLGGYSTFSQCTVDSTKYGFYLHKQNYETPTESARVCVIGGVSAYNSVYVKNYDELGEPTLFWFSDEHTLKGKAVIIVSSNFKATARINCNFDNLTDEDNKICIDQLIPHYENNEEIFWENAHYICINDKADKATTLAGYGITDAYTKTEVDNELTEIRAQIQQILN